MSDITIRLIRTENTEDGVFGKLTVPGHMALHTMEEDWRDNQRSVSCIPAGSYRLRRTIYYRHGYETFEVCGVPGRSRILIHPANTEEDVQGCIGLGVRRGHLWVRQDEDTGALNVRKRAVVASREAFHLFMTWMAGVDEAELVIEWADGEPGDLAA